MCGVLDCAQKNSRNQFVTDYGSKGMGCLSLLLDTYLIH